MLIWFGVRPTVRSLLAPPAVAEPDDPNRTPALAGPQERLLIEQAATEDDFLETLMAKRDNSPARKLIRLVEFDEGQAAAIIKRWIREGANG